MHILIFAEAFLPPAHLPRVRYFCSYFIKKGWNVTLICESSESEKYIPENVSFLTIDYYKNKTNGIIAKIEWIEKFVFNLFYDYKGSFFYKKSKKFLHNKKFDLVFCSSSFTFPLTIAEKVATEMNLPLFIDLRDIIEQSPDDNHYISNKPPKLIGNILIQLYKSINLKRRNKALEKATGVTTVSPWHVQTLSKYNSATHLIYNGFDEAQFIPEEKITDHFTISYFGRVYNEEIRNPRLLFKALSELKQKGELSERDTVIKWYIDEHSKIVIKKIVAEYSIQEFMEYHNFVPLDQLASEMNKSSILLTLSNVSSNKKYFGIMTTKFFESIGTNRPILCIPDNNDDLSKLIKETNCGFISSEVSEIETFLLSKFSEWKKNGQTSGILSESVRLNFSRKKGAEILEAIFKKNID